MSNVFTAAGTTLAVSADLPGEFSDDETGGYPSLTFTNVGEITSIPEHGPEYTLVTHNPLGDRVTVKRKGSVNYGSLTLPLALDPSDEGQGIMRDFADGPNVDDSIAVEITLPDGSVRYFTAQVMSFQEAADGTDSIASGSTMLEIDRPVVYVDAAEE